MEFWKAMSGSLNVEVTSAEPEETLRFLTMRGIETFQIRRPGDLNLRFRIRRKDYPQLEKLCKRRGERLEILDRSGLYWYGNRMGRRPILAVGMAALLAMSLYLPTRILFVQVAGNETVPANRILEAAEARGICFGASRREVRSEQLKNALLSDIPQLQWAGVNTYGCTAVISVRERMEQTEQKDRGGISSIAASRDGYILSATATRGNLVCQVGQGVKAGQILISAYTDCGMVIQAVEAEGTIIAQTNRMVWVCTPSEYCVPMGNQEIKRNYSLILGKKRINLWKGSGISDASCGRMYEESYLTLPGGFRLPIALCVEETVEREWQKEAVLEEDAKRLLESFAEAYLAEQMNDGSIQSHRQVVALEKEVYTLRGTYGCVEQIGRVYREQIGETNG